MRHAAMLMWHLGFRRFGIVVIYWFLRRYRRLTGRAFEGPGEIVRPEEISRDPVLVYQMSKVGSTSLLYSLQFAYLRAGLPTVALHHAHTLSNLDLHEQWAKEAGSRRQLNLVREYKQIRSTILLRPEEHWRVISLVRDPVARQVSDYFHHIDRHLPDWRSRWQQGKLNIDEVVENFLTIHDPTYNWFEAEIDSVFGVDVYASPFPHEAGFGIYSRLPKVTVLVLRLEDLDRVASKAIWQLLGLRDFHLYSFNLASESGYGEIYRQFKSRPLPDWYVEKIYSGRIARHFYTPAELDRFKNKWRS